jgi:hypothetical protein
MRKPEERAQANSSGDAFGTARGWRTGLIYIIDLDQSARVSLIGVGNTPSREGNR